MATTTVSVINASPAARRAIDEALAVHDARMSDAARFAWIVQGGDVLSTLRGLERSLHVEFLIH